MVKILALAFLATFTACDQRSSAPFDQEATAVCTLVSMRNFGNCSLSRLISGSLSYTIIFEDPDVTCIAACDSLGSPGDTPDGRPILCKEPPGMSDPPSRNGTILPPATLKSGRQPTPTLPRGILAESSCV